VALTDENQCNYCKNQTARWLHFENDLKIENMFYFKFEKVKEIKSTYKIFVISK